MTSGTSIARGNPSGIRRVGWMRRRQRKGGYILLELILATILFTVAVVGLAQSARTGTRLFGQLNRENDVRLGLRSFLEEVRRKPMNEMTQTIEEPRLGMTFRSEVEELSLENANGTALRDMYKLRVVASDTTDANAGEESVEVWIYKPRSEERR
jgi:type II secretory pathway pseudopilin PulG